jgi:hypothetical protein
MFQAQAAIQEQTMPEAQHKAAGDAEYFRARAAAEIAVATAAGAKAHASVDNKTVFIERKDGTKETVRLRRARETH